MAFKTVDVLNTVRDTYSGEKIRNLIKKEPLVEELLNLKEGIQKQQAGGYNRISHLVGVDSGVRGRAMITGMEQTERKARSTTKRTEVAPSALIADITLSKYEEEMLRQTGSPLEKKADDLITNASVFAMQDLASRFISGESTSHIWSTAHTKNILTLNGQKTDGTFTGNTNGLLSFDSVANQISGGALVMNLARQADIHFNQSEALAASGELFDKMQRGYLAAQRADSRFNGPTIGFCDIASYIKIFSERRDLVRISKDTDDITSKDFRIAEFGPMRITYSDYIDLTNYAAESAANHDPSNGFITMLNTNYMCFWTLKDKMFELGKWMDTTVAGQRLYVAPLDLHGNFELLNLPAHANISNTLA